MTSHRAPSPARRRPKRPAVDEEEDLKEAAGPSPSSNWIRSIQNQSFEPKPTAYSPHTSEEEDPLMQQQRQCRDKLRALRQVRERMRFYTPESLVIDTHLILSGREDSVDWQDGGDTGSNPKKSHQDVGIDALGGLEMLLFTFFSRQELLKASAVCRAWRALGRDDLFWEPFLVTPLEKYPLRPLLGLEKNLTGTRDHVPAILVYMVFQKLKLAQAPQMADCNATTTPPVARYSDRVLEYIRNLAPNAAGARLLPRLMRRAARGRRKGFSSVHLVCVQNASGLRVEMEQDLRQMANMHLQPPREVAVGVQDGQNHAVVNGQQGAGAADDEDVYSVVDGQQCMTLGSWLATEQRVSERTLRSFLRQVLLAVDALERVNCEHVDISPVNIVVQCHRGVQESSSVTSGLQPLHIGAEDEDVEMTEGQGFDVKSLHESRNQHHSGRRRTPLFQLFLSRRNCQQVGGTQARVQDPTLAAEGEFNVPVMLDVDEDGVRGIAQQRHRLLEVGAVGGGGMAAVLRNRLAFPHPNMVSSVIQCALMVWARGRFVDTNASSLLALLLRFPDHFSNGLRAFLEYAKYLIISHSASASKLLRHEYLQCPEVQLADRTSGHWSATPINDINDYKSKLLAHYNSLPPRLEPLRDEDSSPSVSPAVVDELMPRTNQGPYYFAKALEESNLSAERFVTVVAPSTASSSWVRTLASTQTHTLQRLDLSQTRAPTSVLLQELATLPRLTHLRLPRQILRDENLEHLVAALAYSGVLPHLKGLDESVRQAMDRMERSYLMQLDMFSFLLQKPGAPDSNAATRDCINSTGE
ncbi:hypothetical protein PHYBOEH_003302 [Phytophthora boehmeriae]|uniref:F-box domain-containing protein n=1 Tax=Phytophthora boehmeriae TaxID=109152 RepID=A0A8T1WSY1_9STRA|nr:hypothetical protein PHYBOEH_003302 [Phytophthora boehmeriae]